jgi:hypothetical protein
MQPLERTIVLTASLAVLGAIAGFPSVVAEFPANLILLALPVGVVLLIAPIHRSDDSSPAIISLIAETAGPCAGYAVTFHVYYGEWDYQGVCIGVIGLVVLSPLMIAIVRSWHRKNVDLTNRFG